MASSDWKNELKERIATIREKKKGEQSQANDSAAATVAIPKPELEHSEAEAAAPVSMAGQQGQTPQMIIDEPFVADASELSTGTVVFDDEPGFGDVNDEIFHLDPLTQEGLNTEAMQLRDQLARVAESTSSPEEETRFTTEPAPQPTVAAPPVAPEPAEPILEPKAASRASAVEQFKQAMQSAPEAEDMADAYAIEDSLSTAVDSYIPLDADTSDEYEADDEEQEPRRLVPETVLDQRIVTTAKLRLAAGAIDAVILASIVGVIVWISSMIITIDPLTILSKAWLPLIVLFVVLDFIYYVLFTGVIGQTVGKMLLKLAVVGKKTPIGIGACSLRWLLMIVSVAPLMLGMVMIFVHKDGKALQDLLLGMRVQHVE